MIQSLSTLGAAGVLSLALATPAQAQGSGGMPEFKNATWFNTPALTRADLEDRAVFFEVFRTW